MTLIYGLSELSFIKHFIFGYTAGSFMTLSDGVSEFWLTQL